MAGRGIRLGKIFGIELFIDYSWIIIFVLITWLLSTQYFPRVQHFTTSISWSLGFLTSILFFASALTHELMHSVVAIKNKVRVNKITLFLFGGVSELFEEPNRADTEFKIAIAGPATSLALAVIFSLLWTLAAHYHADFLTALFSTLFEINILLCLFNLLPGFPLDGGRIVRSILWATSKDYKKSTQRASSLGKFVAFVIILFGVFQIIVYGFWGGLWLILIGLFLFQTAGQSYMELLIKEALENIKASDFTNKNIMTMSAYLSINDALSEYFLKDDSISYPVVDADNIVGLVSLKDIQKYAKFLTTESRVCEIMRKYPSEIFLEPQQSVLEALKTMISHELSFIQVKENDKFVGVITLEQIAGYLEQRGVI